ncbi:MAG TPA: carboxypeptidase-like regulatory domain-containing protein [Longimicrobiales bacterium]|nr:carboxypeptidase-like regulatory domain-containing protein [Longimicrobiales bacterium]
MRRARLTPIRRPRPRSLAGVAALAILAGACQADRPPTAPDGGAGDGDVTGTVALVKTGAPVANAIVALIQGGRVLQAAPTDEAGHFAFDRVPPGSYTVHLTGIELTAEDPLFTSFEPLSQSVTRAAEPLHVYFGGEGIVPARLTGFVTCRGAAVAGARVRIVGGATDTTVVTTEQGRYGSPDLAAGAYAVYLEAADPCGYPTPFQAGRVKTGQLLRLDFEGGG